MNKLRDLLYRSTTEGQRRFLKFCTVGASGVPVNLVFAWIGYALLFASLSPAWRDGCAFTLGITISIFTNFLLNDLWTWADRGGDGSSFWGRLARFYLVCSGASLVQFGVAMALSIWVGIHQILAQLAGIAIATVINYVVNNFWTFKQSKASQDGSTTSPP